MSDPAEEAERRRALRDEEERARRAAQHDIENLTRKQPGVYGQRVHAACIKTPASRPSTGSCAGPRWPGCPGMRGRPGSGGKSPTWGRPGTTRPRSIAAP